MGKPPLRAPMEAETATAGAAVPLALPASSSQPWKARLAPLGVVQVPACSPGRQTLNSSQASSAAQYSPQAAGELADTTPSCSPSMAECGAMT